MQPPRPWTAAAAAGLVLVLFLALRRPDAGAPRDARLATCLASDIPGVAHLSGSNCTLRLAAGQVCTLQCARGYTATNAVRCDRKGTLTSARCVVDADDDGGYSDDVVVPRPPPAVVFSDSDVHAVQVVRLQIGSALVCYTATDRGLRCRTVTAAPLLLPSAVPALSLGPEVEVIPHHHSGDSLVLAALGWDRAVVCVAMPAQTCAVVSVVAGVPVVSGPPEASFPPHHRPPSPMPVLPPPTATAPRPTLSLPHRSPRSAPQRNWPSQRSRKAEPSSARRVL